jgi:hypothetical protein
VDESYNTNPYRRGIFSTLSPIPSDPAHCTPVEAGPLTFVIESRVLTDEAVDTVVTAERRAAELGGISFNDRGGTVHVCDRAGIEHLRFDCFEREPHYHYLMHPDRGQLVCRIDDVAVEDPVDWSLTVLRTRLPEMLRSTGAFELATTVQSRYGEVLLAIDRVAELLASGQEQAQGDDHRGG